MPDRDTIVETGTVKLAEREFPVSRVITEKRCFTRVPGQKPQDPPVEAQVWELAKDEGQRGNPAFVLVDGKWTEGHTFQRRWSIGNGYPERQNVFESNDGELTFVVTSERITV